LLWLVEGPPMDELVRTLLVFFGGGLTAFAAVAILVFLNPDKVQIWVSWFYGAARLVVKRAEYGLVANEVAGHLNRHFAESVYGQIEGVRRARIEIHWTNDAASVAVQRQGTLIVRMRDHEHKDANILHASLAATPRLIAPAVRDDLRPEQSRAVDLQLCRRLAEHLGDSAKAFYRTEIAGPAVEAVPELQPLLERLQQLELGGFFVPIFLQELLKVGGGEVVIDPRAGLAQDVDDFAGFLETIAQKPGGEDVALSYLGTWFKVSVPLLARRYNQSIAVFRNRVGMELGKGVNTVYLMALDENIPFAAEVADALDADRRVVRRKERRVTVLKNGQSRRGVIVPFERNTGYSFTDHFHELVQTLGLRPGDEVDALVTGVESEFVLVDVRGVQGTIPCAEWAWEHVADCRDAVRVGDEVSAQLVRIDSDRLEVRLSRRALLPSPISSLSADQAKGGAHQFRVVSRRRRKDRIAYTGFVTINGAEYPARLAAGEVTWGAHAGRARIGKGESFEVIVLRLREDQGYVEVSRKRAVMDRWDLIRTEYPRGADVDVTVLSVAATGVYCEVQPGLIGFVPADEFRRAGHEYEDFEQNLRPRQRLYTYVGRVVGGNKKRLTLRLRINR
jgi:predicted RNA-binding protein with RPS1 domain